MKNITNQQWKDLQIKCAYWNSRLRKLMDKGDTRSSKYMEAFHKSKALNKACDIVDNITDSVEVPKKDLKEFWESLSPKVQKWVKKSNKKLDFDVKFILNNL